LKKVLFNIVFIAMPLLLPAQQGVRNDTIQINEVIIRRMASSEQLPGYKTVRIDSSALAHYGNKDIADLLSGNSTVIIKSYGAGGIATPAFRGTGAGHTQVAWNNISINNPMTGQFDLSLVPAGLIDKVDIYFGAGSMDINGGGLGGLINLTTAPDWKERFSILLNPSAGSFGQYSGLLRLNAGTDRLQSSTKLIMQSADNNFPYLNTVNGGEPVQEIRKNDQVRQKGVTEDLSFRLPGGTLTAKFWYQSVFRNLPEPIISMQGNSGETQRDESLRSLVNYSRDKGPVLLDLTGAVISDNLHYVNTIASIDSRNSSERFVLRGSSELKIGSKTRLRTDMGEELSVVRTNNYSGIKQRNTLTASGVLETYFSDRLSGRLLMRETMSDRKMFYPDFSTGAQARIIPGRELFISANFSRNSKIPSLNDLYWSPGGNQDLRSETSLSSELMVTASADISSFLKMKAGLTGYYSLISDMIQWKPGDFSWWEAENTGTIRTSGVESSLVFTYATSVVRVTADAGYTLTFAADESRNQAIYVPVHRINGIIRFATDHFYGRYAANFSSRRYLIADNTQFLPAYWISDLGIGSRLGSPGASVDISLDVTNILNASYQSIAWYPMPGRAFLISVAFKLNNRK